LVADDAADRSTEQRARGGVAIGIRRVGVIVGAIRQRESQTGKKNEFGFHVMREAMFRK
jgi:hypothetical protein